MSSYRRDVHVLCITMIVKNILWRVGRARIFISYHTNSLSLSLCLFRFLSYQRAEHTPLHCYMAEVLFLLHANDGMVLVHVCGCACIPAQVLLSTACDDRMNQKMCVCVCYPCTSSSLPSGGTEAPVENEKRFHSARAHKLMLTAIKRWYQFGFQIRITHSLNLWTDK